MKPVKDFEKMAERTESADGYKYWFLGSSGQHFALHFKPAAFGKNL